jgi:methionine-S-sulfoxide reductase
VSDASAEAVFAGGCFWCVEAVFERLKGVADVTSGYAGGSDTSANYDAVCSGTTGHAEVVKITYDPQTVAYEQLLELFFATHDPTTKDRQGADVGSQYRSAIFFADDDQKQRSEKFISAIGESDAFDAPIVTTLEPLETFYPAETYHQDFARQNPSHPYICQITNLKVEKARKLFGDLIQD